MSRSSAPSGCTAVHEWDSVVSPAGVSAMTSAPAQQVAHRRDDDSDPPYDSHSRTTAEYTRGAEPVFCGSLLVSSVRTDRASSAGRGNGTKQDFR